MCSAAAGSGSSARRSGLSIPGVERLSPFESISFTLYASGEWRTRERLGRASALWLVLCWGDREGNVSGREGTPKLAERDEAEGARRSHGRNVYSRWAYVYIYVYSLCCKRYPSSITEHLKVLGRVDSSTTCFAGIHMLCLPTLVAPLQTAICCTELSPTKVPLLYLIILCYILTIFPCYHCYSAVLHFPHYPIYKLLSSHGQ
jgi:hypothetical protein